MRSKFVVSSSGRSPSGISNRTANRHCAQVNYIMGFTQFLTISSRILVTPFTTFRYLKEHYNIMFMRSVYRSGWGGKKKTNGKKLYKKKKDIEELFKERRIKYITG